MKPFIAIPKPFAAFTEAVRGIHRSRSRHSPKPFVALLKPFVALLKPFVVRLSNHERLHAPRPGFPVRPSRTSGRTGNPASV
jgi:hypothetical protein